MIRSLFFWIPMTLVLLLIWLLLASQITVGQVLLGLVISFCLVLLSKRLRPDLAYPRKITAVVMLIAIVIRDLISSNWFVFKTILNPKSNAPETAFVNIPLSLRDPHGLAFLACIITYVPGTVWSGLTENSYILRLHVFGKTDEIYWKNCIKNDYEKYLMEIFE